MKKVIGIIAVLALVGSAFAKKEQSEPVTYPYTGKVVLYAHANHSDSEAHVTVDGNTYSAYCNMTGTSVDCTDKGATVYTYVDLYNAPIADSPPVSVFDNSDVVDTITFEGRVYSAFESLGPNPQKPLCLTPLFACDPVKTLEQQLLSGFHNGDAFTFRYRLVVFTKDAKGLETFGQSRVGKAYYCVPFDATEFVGQDKVGLTKMGKTKHGEACYETKQQVHTSVPVISPVLDDQNRKAFADELTQAMHKGGGFGHAEAIGTVLAMHSERCSQEQFNKLVVSNDKLQAALRSLKFKSIVYTNDADLKFVYDLEKSALPTTTPPATPETPAEPTPSVATPEKLAADRKAWLDTINTPEPGRKGHGEIDGDTLIIHSAECTRQNFDLLVANPHMKQVFSSLKIKLFVYTNDLDLTFKCDVEKGVEVK